MKWPMLLSFMLVQRCKAECGNPLDVPRGRLILSNKVRVRAIHTQVCILAMGVSSCGPPLQLAAPCL